jgi:hypothetical protein
MINILILLQTNYIKKYLYTYYFILKVIARPCSNRTAYLLYKFKYNLKMSILLFWIKYKVQEYNTILKANKRLI